MLLPDGYLFFSKTSIFNRLCIAVVKRYFVSDLLMKGVCQLSIRLRSRFIQCFLDALCTRRWCYRCTARWWERFSIVATVRIIFVFICHLFCLHRCFNITSYRLKSIHTFTHQDNWDGGFEAGFVSGGILEFFRWSLFSFIHIEND